MAPRRFMVPSRAIRDGYASFDGELFNHMVRVLRLGPGDPLELVDERGTVHTGVVDQITREWVAVRIAGSSAKPDGETADGPAITICQALPKGEKTELILQKGTELGAHEFWFFGGVRSVARLRADQQAARLERWGRIVAEAARQCGRRTVPAVSWLTDAEAAAARSEHELRLLLWEEEREQGLKKTLEGSGRPASAIVAIGPEGGFDPREVRAFGNRGFLPVSLGPRILRTETASIAILAIMQYKWED